MIGWVMGVLGLFFVVLVYDVGGYLVVVMGIKVSFVRL